MKLLSSLVRNVHSRPLVNWSAVQLRFLQQDSDSEAKPKKDKDPPDSDPYGPRPHQPSKIVELTQSLVALSPEERKQVASAVNQHLWLLKQLGEVQSIGAKQGAGAGTAEVQKEKWSFDVKLEKFDAASKATVIEEVRAITCLGLKEAEELVEKVPILLKQGLTKEAANEIIAKIKAAGGFAVMEPNEYCDPDSSPPFSLTPSSPPPRQNVENFHYSAPYQSGLSLGCLGLPNRLRFRIYSIWPENCYQAHVVSGATSVLVKKPGSGTKYVAKPRGFCNECDLAVLLVEDEEFWDGLEALELTEDIPHLSETVRIIGYPQGTNKFSVCSKLH